MSVAPPPSVDALVRHGPWESWGLRRHVVVQEARAIIESLRQSGLPTSLEDAAACLESRCRALSTHLERTINATGLLLHTNLGRAPTEATWGESAWGYADVEFERETGERGSRLGRLEKLAQALWAVPAAAVVNNNAAALVLAVRAVANGGAVVVSRGEAVQIGGGFRVPAIVEAAGARLVEVGTTNITTLDDYAEALRRLGPASAILRVHRSNFALEGHVASPTDQALGTLAKAQGVALVVDQGGGATEAFRRFVQANCGATLPEATVEQLCDAGATLITFSGDKLLGGPQAGFIVGDAGKVGRARKDPLARAFRLDKVRVAALESLLRQWLAPNPKIPLLERLATPVAKLESRAEKLVDALHRHRAAVRHFQTPLGGGATPSWELPSAGFAMAAGDGETRYRALVAGTPSVVPRRDRGQLLFDLRSVAPEEDALLLQRLESLA